MGDLRYKRVWLMIIFAIITVISSNPCLILHNELALTKFEICFRDLVK